MSIKVAIVGAGEVVNGVHLPSWNKVRQAEIAAICDIDEAAARNTADHWKIPHYYTEFTQLLDCEKPFLVDICTPPGTHLPLTVQALEAGSNVLLEKPMAMTLEDTDKIIKAYTERKDKNLQLAVIHNWLFLPPIRDMLSEVKAGRIGDIIHVEFRAFSHDDPMMSDPNHWCHSLRGGRFGEGLIHPIYLLYRLLGSLEMKSLYIAKKGPWPWAAYDEAFITFEGDKGFASIYNSHNSPMDDFPVLSIYGTRSHLMFDSYNFAVLSRRPTSGGAFGKGVAILREINQLSGSLGLNVFNKVVHGQPKTGHEVYFSLLIDSLVNKKELPLSPEEAYEANRVFLKVLSELEKLKPWKADLYREDFPPDYHKR